MFALIHDSISWVMMLPNRSSPIIRSNRSFTSAGISVQNVIEFKLMAADVGPSTRCLISKKHNNRFFCRSMTTAHNQVRREMSPGFWSWIKSLFYWISALKCHWWIPQRLESCCRIFFNSFLITLIYAVQITVKRDINATFLGFLIRPFKRHRLWITEDF